QRIARARAAIGAHYDGLEQRLGDRPWLCGEFSVADIGYALTITFAANLGVPLGDAHPRLQAWYGRVIARPSVTKELTGLAGAVERATAWRGLRPAPRVAESRPRRDGRPDVAQR